VLQEHADIPTFGHLFLRHGGDPCTKGPPPDVWQGLGIDYSLYEFDAHDPKYYRTLSMQEMQADIPTGAWPAIGDPHGRTGTTGERDVASP
jgi:hypothetical protein